MWQLTFFGGLFFGVFGVVGVFGGAGGHGGGVTCLGGVEGAFGGMVDCCEDGM